MRQSASSNIGLLIINGLDYCDARLRATLKPGVLRFGLHPLDGMVRPVVVTLWSFQGADEVVQLADWLGAKTRTDALLSDEPRRCTWTPEPLRDVILTLLVSQDEGSFDSLYRIIRWGFLETVVALDRLLLELLQAGVVYADARRDEGTIYSADRTRQDDGPPLAVAD